MKIDKLLISSAMLAAMSEKTGTDNLKMLEPFVLVCLADVCEPKEKIPKIRVLSMLEQRFALLSMPEAVLDKILSRIARSGAHIVHEKKSTKGSRQFELVQKPTELVRTFLAQEDRARRDTEAVVNTLIDWVSSNTMMKKPTTDEAEKYLGYFFESNGFDILFDPEILRGATRHNTDEINYQIGRFILSVQETDPVLFEKIVAIAQGIIVASVIYVDTKPVSKLTAQRRLSGLDVFLDTTFLLYALGYKTKGQKSTADILLNLLRNNGANLYVFSSHFAEIAEILNTFREAKVYESNAQLLEAFIEEGYSWLQIDLEIRRLKDNLSKLGIEVAHETQYADPNGKLFSNKDAYIDYDGLKAHLTEKIPQYGKRPRMLENDVSAIGSIMARRSGMAYTDIESCNAIFVTTNYTLVRQGNKFLQYSPRSMRIAPIMSDTDLTTILWIKYAMTRSSEISKLQLVEYARAAMMPSASVMERFNSIVKSLIQKGTMSEDEAACMRYSAYARAEIAALCGGNASMLDANKILLAWEQTKGQFAVKETERADQAYAAVQHLERSAQHLKRNAKNLKRAAEAAEIKAEKTANKLETAKQKGKDEIAQLRKDAQDTAQRQAHLLARIGQILSALFVVAVMLISGWSTIKAGLSSSVDIFGIVALVVAVISAIVLWTPAFKLSKRLYLALSSKAFDWRYATELKKRQKEIHRIELIFERE